MPQHLAIEIVAADVLTFASDVLVLKYAQALHGLEAIAHKRLLTAGQLPRLPAVGSSTISDSSGRLGAKRTLFVGVQPLTQFRYSEIREFGKSAMTSLARSTPDAQHLALTLHGPGYGLDEVDAFRAEFAGIVEALDAGHYPRALNKISFVEHNENRASKLRNVLGELLPTGLIELNQAGVSSPTDQSEKGIAGQRSSATVRTDHMWDVFISHASEDKQSFVRPLARALEQEGLRVWYDESTLRIGDSLRRAIDKGLVNSKYAIVVVSESFLRKEWPQKELDALVSRETGERQVILPVWHNVTVEDVRARSAMLADRVATSSAKGLKSVVADLLNAMRYGSHNA
jgi:hypothetical protein